MKRKFTILFLLVSISITGQTTEFIILGGVQDNNPTTNNILSDAISELNGIGTVTIKGNIILKNDFTIPKGIELHFFNGNKLIIDNNVKLTLNGSINAGLRQIFDLKNDAKIVGNTKIQKVYPHWWGAVQNDTISDDKSINEALNFIFNKQKPLSGIKNNNSRTSNSNIALDFAGGEFILKNKILLPETSTYQLINGIIRASDNFTDDYLFDTYIEKTDTNEERRFTRENIFFSEIVLNCNYKTNGIRLANAIRWVFDKFSIFDIKENKNGLLIHSASNEIIITNSFFINKEFFVDNPINQTGTGIKLENNGGGSNSDHHFSNIAMKGLKYGVRSVSSTANVYDKIHFYDSTYGMKLEGNTSANRIFNCYFDVCKLNIENPSRSSVTNCYFAYKGTDENYSPFEIETASGGPTNIWIRGFIVKNNIFDCLSPNLSIEAFKIINKPGYKFDQNNIFDTYVKDNTGSGNVNIKSTHFAIKKTFLDTPSSHYVYITPQEFDSKVLFGTLKSHSVNFTSYAEASTSVTLTYTGYGAYKYDWTNSEEDLKYGFRFKLSTPIKGELFFKVVTSNNIK